MYSTNVLVMDKSTTAAGHPPWQRGGHLHRGGPLLDIIYTRYASDIPGSGLASVS